MKPSLSCLFLLCAFFPAVAQGAQEPQVVHTFSIYGQSIGENGMIQGSTQGRRELYIDGLFWDSFWHALRYDQAAGTYTQTFTSPLFDSPIIAMSLGEVHPNPGQELLVLLDNGDIYVYDQWDKEVLEVIDTNRSHATGFAVHDLDGDGQDELALLTGSGLYVEDANGVLITTFNSLHGTGVVIGQMDGDPSMEIASTDGNVVDYITGSVQCTWANGFGFEMRLDDFDNDGMEELIYSEHNGDAEAIDVDLCQAKWTIPVTSIAAMTVGDSDDDGQDELLLGNFGLFGGITSYDLATGTFHWAIPNPNDGVTSILVADIDMDGSTELLWGSGAMSTAPDNLYIWNVTNGVMEWQSLDLTGPFTGPDYGDVDGDGIAEVVSASLNSETVAGTGRIIVLEQDSFVPTISPPTQRGHGTDGLHDLILFDTDGDGDQEIGIAGSEYHDGLLEIYDYSAGVFSLIWDSDMTSPGSIFHSIDIGDLDGDGTLEVIGGTGWVYLSGEVNVIAYDFATGAEEWRGQAVPNADRISDLVHGDFDQDGQLEIGALVDDTGVYFYSGAGVLEAVVPGDFSSMDLATGTGGGPPFLMMGTNTGDIHKLSWSQGAYTLGPPIDLATMPIHGLTPWKSGRFFASVGDRLEFYDLATPSSPLWQSEAYGSLLGSHVIRLANHDFATAGVMGIFDFRVR